MALRQVPQRDALSGPKDCPAASCLAFTLLSPAKARRLTSARTQDDEAASVVSVGCCGPANALDANSRQMRQNSDIFSSFHRWSTNTSEHEDGGSLLASFNVFSNGSNGGSWMPFEAFGKSAGASNADSSGASGDGREFESGERKTAANSEEYNVFQAMNIFEGEKVEEEDTWVDMAASMDEDLRKRSKGMDIRMMQEHDLEDLFLKIGGRLQQAKESSQVHSGQVDGDYVLRTVTVWEINFWEACEWSKATTGLLDRDFIGEHLDQHRGKDLIQHPDHWQSIETPFGCLLLGIPFNAATGYGRRPPSSIGTSRVSEGIATLLDPTDEMCAVVHAPSVRDTAEESTPADRFHAMMKRGTVSLDEKLKFSQNFAMTHCDWIAVKEYMHGKNPLVVSNFNGKDVYQSDLKNCSVREIKAIMRWREAEVSQRRRLVFHCVGKPLPDMFQRCIHRLSHDAQDAIREKLAKVRRHGSTALDLQEAARIIVENGGGYSAAVELKYDMEEPDHLKTMPTPSQAAEMQRTNMMRDMRDGNIDAQDMLNSMFSATGSRRGRSVTEGRSKLDTPGYKALVTPRENVDLYNARYLGDDAESLYSSLASRPSGLEHLEVESLSSQKVQHAAARAHTKLDSGMPYVNVFKNTNVATDKALIDRVPKRQAPRRPTRR